MWKVYWLDLLEQIPAPYYLTQIQTQLEPRMRKDSIILSWMSEIKCHLEHQLISNSLSFLMPDLDSMCVSQEQSCCKKPKKKSWRKHKILKRSNRKKKLFFSKRLKMRLRLRVRVYRRTLQEKFLLLNLQSSFKKLKLYLQRISVRKLHRKWLRQPNLSITSEKNTIFHQLRLMLRKLKQPKNFWRNISSTKIKEEEEEDWKQPQLILQVVVKTYLNQLTQQSSRWLLTWQSLNGTNRKHILMLQQVWQNQSISKRRWRNMFRLFTKIQKV